MKKKTFKSFFAVVLAVLVFAFSGCSLLNKPKTFKKDEVSITLTNLFFELEDMGFDYCIATYNMVVLFSKYGYSFTSEEKDWTIQQYAQEFIDSNDLNDSVVKMSDDGYAYVEYSGSYDGENYLYYATIHKTSTAFWLIQFGCISDEYEKAYEKIEKYASSITFTDTPMANV